MLTENRKRHYSCNDEEEETLHQAKRTPSNPLGHDVWDMNSSSSESSGISSPERLSGAGTIIQTTEHMEKHFLQDSCSPCSTLHFDDKPNLFLGKTKDSYYQVNCILREAHFSSLKIHGQQRPT
ncbi:uncharacterized protein si:dkey-21c1.1 isoform X2 [Trichomycterus rosablanca]